MIDNPMRPVPLNSFQRIMRLWDQVHPYNAAHACRIAGSADIDRISDAWRSTLKQMGVGKISVRGTEFLHRAPADHDPGMAPQVYQNGRTIDQLITDEMNTRMNPDEGCPFRAFVLAEGDTYCIGVNYHHWVADSASIRWLMHEWFQRIQTPSGGSGRKAHIPHRGPWHYFGPQAAKWRLDEAILSLLRYRTRFSRARFIEAPIPDCRVAVTFHHLPDGLAAPLVKLARRHRATFNDLMLAVMAQSIDRLGATPRRPGRDELALGTIVDVRHQSPAPMDDIFGLFLGFTTTTLRNQDLESWDRLLQRIARQNAFHKQSKAALASVLRMVAVLIDSKFTTPHRWAEVNRRTLPLAGGISNVNMNRTWAGDHHPARILDYYRVAPTGTLLPAAFTPTTLGTRLNFGITRLACLFDETRTAAIAQSISNRLIELAEDAR